MLDRAAVMTTTFMIPAASRIPDWANTLTKGLSAIVLDTFLAAAGVGRDVEFLMLDGSRVTASAVIDAYAEAILALDDSVPTGTYVDMCSKLPVIDPANLNVPVLIMRGQFDGIASNEDLLDFFARLPNPDKQFSMMAGIAHNSTKQINYRISYHILL